MNTMHLVGAEDVGRAASRMIDAAHLMQAAASQIEDAMQRRRMWEEEYLARIEAIVREELDTYKLFKVTEGAADTPAPPQHTTEAKSRAAVGNGAQPSSVTNLGAEGAVQAAPMPRKEAEMLLAALQQLRDVYAITAKSARKTDAGTGSAWELSGYVHLLERAIKDVGIHHRRAQGIDRQVERERASVDPLPQVEEQ